MQAAYRFVMPFAELIVRMRPWARMSATIFLAWGLIQLFFDARLRVEPLLGPTVATFAGVWAVAFALGTTLAMLAGVIFVLERGR